MGTDRRMRDFLTCAHIYLRNIITLALRFRWQSIDAMESLPGSTNRDSCLTKQKPRRSQLLPKLQLAFESPWHTPYPLHIQASYLIRLPTNMYMFNHCMRPSMAVLMTSVLHFAIGHRLPSRRAHETSKCTPNPTFSIERPLHPFSDMSRSNTPVPQSALITLFWIPTAQPFWLHVGYIWWIDCVSISRWQSTPPFVHNLQLFVYILDILNACQALLLLSWHTYMTQITARKS